MLSECLSSDFFEAQIMDANNLYIHEIVPLPGAYSK